MTQRRSRNLPTNSSHVFHKRLVKLVRKRPVYIFGYLIVATALLLMVLGPQLAPYPPERPDPMQLRLAPNSEHWLGTDAAGMDILSRIVAAPRIDLTIGIVGTALAMLIGIPMGVMAGYSGRRFSGLIMRFADILQAFPVFVLALVLVASLGQGPVNMVLALAFVNAPVYIRLLRAEVLATKRRSFIEAARVTGLPVSIILRSHVLPNSIQPALVQGSVNVGWGILLTASLSFVGAGVRHPTPEWGLMIASGAENLIVGEWWMATFPGVALAITVWGFAVVGDSLTELLGSPTVSR